MAVYGDQIPGDVIDEDVEEGVGEGEGLPPARTVPDAAEAEYLPISRLQPAMQFTVLQGHWRDDADHSREWRGLANFWFGFRAGEQWSDDDKALLNLQQRPHIVFNRVLTILKAVAGMEINGRHEVQYLPRNTEDTAANEVLSGASKWMADECDGEDEESQAFDDTATCGMGWVEERMSFTKDPKGLYVEDQVDPREMYWDRSAKKKNLSDARRISRAKRISLADAVRMFPGKTREQLDAVWADDYLGDSSLRSVEEKRRRDSDNGLAYYDDSCEVTIVHMQWIEHESYWLVADPTTNTQVEMTDAQHRTLVQRLEPFGVKIKAARLEREVYKQAFLGGELLRPVRAAPIKGQFSWKCITGERDKLKNHWFGLVHVLRDPQMWANKWLSQILHILNTTAKGGILAETDAFDDQREAEEGYAMSDNITWMTKGALSGQKPKVMPKPGQGMTDAYLGLLTFAISSFKDVSGINLELLGQQDQNQPGVIEAMRKQAGMTVLATLFDSLRRFRKQVGRSRLFFIQRFLSDGRLIRIMGEDGMKAVALAKERTFGEYDVVVDDTPTSPNQKEANWAIIQPMLVTFRDQLTAQPEILALLLEYSPLPARIVEAIKALIKKGQENPEAQAQKQLGMRAMAATIAKEESAAELNRAKAQKEGATAMWDIATARNLLEDNLRAGRLEEAQGQIDMIVAQYNAVKAEADAQKSIAQAESARASIGAEMVEAGTRRIEAETEAQRAENEGRTARIGVLIDELAGVAGARRDAAAAEKDLALARKADREPAVPAGGAK